MNWAIKKAFLTTALLYKCRLRLLAEPKGYWLDDIGLFPASGSGGTHVSSWVNIFHVAKTSFNGLLDVACVNFVPECKN